MTRAAHESWNRYPRTRARALPLFWRCDDLPLEHGHRPLLPFGQGRSYGDCCLNDRGTLLDTAGLDHFIAFDTRTGVLRCEAGVTLEAILALVVPRGWFLPVTPGTRFVSVGGAIANDIHGKNHHGAGTFGRHVRRFELLRSDGRRLLCAPDTHRDWYRATIGGLGLTGLITWAEMQLRPVANPLMVVETLPFHDLAGFFALARESVHEYEYTVAWVDCLAQGAQLGRGLFMRANHAPANAGHHLPARKSRMRILPFNLPGWLLNRATVAGFNRLYRFGRTRGPARRFVRHEPFFYPLDGIRQWNRLYGRRGFFQYQCVVPDDDPGAIESILRTIAGSGRASFLSVLKTFGPMRSPGLLSFPRQGVTLALDFPNRGARTLALLEQLDAVTRSAGGAVYPAKDARMSARSFQAYYPQWRAFAAFVDPRFSSSFWRRVTQRVSEDNHETSVDTRRDLRNCAGGR